MIKTCLKCNQQICQFSNQWRSQKYCSDRCRKSAFKKKKAAQRRVEQRRANMLQNYEHLYLVYQCRRAGTVQVLYGHDYDSFAKTMALVKNRPKLDVDLCHIFPVKGIGRTGLFHHENLFYGGKYQNQKLGNRSFGVGRFIHNSLLLTEWAVGPNDSTNEVLVKIERYLGSIMVRYLQGLPVRKSPKAVLAQKIAHLDAKRDFEDLLRATYSDLQSMMHILTNQVQFRLPVKARHSKYMNYLDELSRFISYKDSNCKYLKVVRKLMFIGYVCLAKVRASNTFNAQLVPKYYDFILPCSSACLRVDELWSEFKDFMYDTAFFALQGKRVSLLYLVLTFYKYVDFKSIFADKALSRG